MTKRSLVFFIECTLKLFVVFFRSHWSITSIQPNQYIIIRQRFHCICSLHPLLSTSMCRLAYISIKYRNRGSLSNFDAWMKLHNAQPHSHLSPPCPCLRLPWRYPLSPLLRWPYQRYSGCWRRRKFTATNSYSDYEYFGYVFT